MDSVYNVVEQDVVIEDGAVGVRRYLVIANQTLACPDLHELVRQRCSVGSAEFHVLVPQRRRVVLGADPLTGMMADVLLEDQLRLDEQAHIDAEERLQSFRAEFAELGGSLSGEVGIGDPLAAARQVMERASFDEIMVSTLPSGVSKWLHMDLPARFRRAFSVPVISLIQTRGPVATGLAVAAQVLAWNAAWAEARIWARSAAMSISSSRRGRRIAPRAALARTRSPLLGSVPTRMSRRRAAWSARR